MQHPAQKLPEDLASFQALTHTSPARVFIATTIVLDTCKPEQTPSYVKTHTLVFPYRHVTGNKQHGRLADYNKWQISPLILNTLLLLEDKTKHLTDEFDHHLIKDAWYTQPLRGSCLPQKFSEKKKKATDIWNKWRCTPHNTKTDTIVFTLPILYYSITFKHVC